MCSHNNDKIQVNITVFGETAAVCLDTQHITQNTKMECSDLKTSCGNVSGSIVLTEYTNTDFWETSNTSDFKVPSQMPTILCTQEQILKTFIFPYTSKDKARELPTNRYSDFLVGNCTVKCKSKNVTSADKATVVALTWSLR